MQHVLHRTACGVIIGVDEGKKSLKDFIVRYKEPCKKERTPKHIHIIIDLYMKKIGNPNLTMGLVDYVIGLIKNVQPSQYFPPKFQFFNWGTVQLFQSLNCYGEYSAEFLLAVVELLMIQEKTNYPNGKMNLKLFQKFRQGADIFSVVSAATFRGR